jgi:hypothetical protein
MTADYPNAIGDCGTTADTYNMLYSGVPYGTGDFNKPCDINNYQDPVKVSDNEL